MLKLSRPFVVFSFLLLFASVIFATEKIDINTASLEQLDKIIGIGPVLAQRIVDARPFSSVDDLIKVKGIGEKTLQKIKDQELAYVGGQLSAEDPISENSQIEDGPLSTYPSNIVINELLPSPEGPDAEEEWIELYNQNSFPVLLSGWKLEDSIGQINTFTFPENYQIAANGFLVLNRQITKIVLNNDEDGLKLIQPNEVVADQVAFKNALRGQSYSRTRENNWKWTSFLTPGAENIFEDATAQTIKEQSDSNQTKESELEAKQDLSKKELATINEPASSNFSFLLTAFSISLFSGVFILILKKRIDFNDKLK